MAPSTTSVIVPTYRRPDHLARCLAALANQRRPAHQVIVVCRPDDAETAGVIGTAGGRAVSTVHVTVPGVVAAMSAGLDAATGDVIALTDDDAAPHPDWLERIDPYWADPTVGGVGGRDELYYPDGRVEHGRAGVVGRISWFGRTTGNHHLGCGPARDVDLLKGVNCAYKAAVLRQVGFEHRLRGQGAQVHWELALGLGVRRLGYRLVYDPAVRVDHHCGPRRDADTNHRGVFNATGLTDIAYNETAVLRAYLPAWQRAGFRLWSTAIGTRVTPGLLHRALGWRTGQPNNAARHAAAAHGRADAWREPRWLPHGERHPSST